MKKLIAMLGFAFIICADAAGRTNVMFGDRINQFAFSAGYGLGDSRSNAFNGILALRYSQPAEFMRLDGRLNIQAGYIGGAVTPWTIVGSSLDVILFDWRKLWLGAGFGGFIRNKETDRLDSCFTFGEKVFIGYDINEKFSVEFFVQHFSNGNLTGKNLGYNFLGLSFATKF
jgi:hypothetical protein